MADRATIDPTKTHIALPLSTPPTIDGTIDTDEWNSAGGFANDYWRVAANPDLSDGVLGGVVGVGTAPEDNDDLSFRIYVGYDTGNTSFTFRNSGGGTVANDLIRFFVKSGTDVLPGPALLDDIYLATGKVLTRADTTDALKGARSRP